MALRGDPRILLVFSILACNTKINNFFAPHSSSKMPETGAAYTPGTVLPAEQPPPQPDLWDHLAYIEPII